MTRSEGAAVPTRRAGVLCARLGEDLVLFDPHRWRAHGLNRSAALVWDRCDGAHDVAALVADLMAGPAAGSDPDRVATDVAATIAGLADEGLVTLAGAPGPPSGHDAGALDEPAPVPGTARFVRASLDRPAPPGLDAALRDAVTIGPYGAFGTTVTLRCADRDLADWLAQVLAPLAEPATGTTPTGGPGTAHVYRVVGGHPDPALDHLITVDGFAVAQRSDDAALATHLIWHVNQLLCSTPTDRLLIHAGAIAEGDDAIVLPAVMNAGKSTLIAGLVQDGLDYLTDECASLGADGTVDPYPRAISLQSGSWRVLPHLAPPTPAEERRFDTGAWFVDPDRVRPGAARHTPGRLQAFVFCSYAPDRPTALTAMTPLEAATELARNSFNLPELGGPGLDLLVDLAGRIPSWRLERSDLAGGVAAVRAVLGDRRPAPPTTTVAR